MKALTKIQIICFFILILFTSYISAQTEISGKIPFSTTWRVDLSPYSVIGDVQVPDGVTLTIEPGVEIQFAGAYEILVQGNIIANGTETDTITFTGSVPGVSSGADQLRFEGTDLSNSQLSYVSMEYAARAIQIGEETEHDQGGKNEDTLAVTHAKIYKADVITDGYGTGAVLLLNNADISSSTIRGIYPRSEKIIIQNAEIDSCTINSDSYNYGITLENSDITNSQFTIGCCGANFHIIGSNITESSFSEYNNNYYVEIKESQLINTSLSLSAASGVSIFKSTIQYIGDYSISCKNLSMDSTSITGNGTGIGLQLYGNNNISASTITNNGTGIRIMDQADLTVQNSKMLNNTTYNIENLSAEGITATDNWWGNIDVAEIKTKIWDYYDDINYGKVVFSPLLMTEEGPSNYVPEVDVFADPLLGRVPSTVTFTASATDPDGTIALHEWDFDGDGTYDWNSTVNGNTTFEYVESCRHAIALSVSDNQGLANILSYNINIIDFHTGVEVMGATVALEWDWGNYQTVLIPYEALTFLDNGDEVHIIDEDGIITETCPIEEDDYGEISVSNNEYSDTYDSIYVFRCMEAINNCEYNSTVQKGYTSGDTMIFKVYDTSEANHYEIFPETIDNGSIVFGDTAITLITSFNTMYTENEFAKKAYNTHGTKSFPIIANITKDDFKFNIYKNDILLKEAFTQKYYFDPDIQEYNTYSYEVYIVNAAGEEVLSRSKTITTGLLTDLFNITDRIDTYHLFQNYPNPFNPATTISFQIPETSFVTLSIYDLNGRLIETLINESKNAGYYTIKWNADHIVSGIYIYRIDAGNFSSVKKCLIIK
jgi:hypothetical protein